MRPGSGLERGNPLTAVSASRLAARPEFPGMTWLRDYFPGRKLIVFINILSTTEKCVQVKIKVDMAIRFWEDCAPKEPVC